VQHAALTQTQTVVTRRRDKARPKSAKSRATSEAPVEAGAVEQLLAGGRMLGSSAATITGGCVVVIAQLDAVLNDAITTRCRVTIDAGVSVNRVGVITVFTDICDAITTEGQHTGATTAIIVVLVAVITLLTGLQDAITADRIIVLYSAHRGAAVIIRSVAIITLLYTNADEGITAASILTRGEASIGVVIIAVITWLADLHEPVTTDCTTLGSTSGGAAIAVGYVAIIAGLGTNTNDAITAASVLTDVSAGVVVIGVAVVAGLGTNTNDAITAAGILTDVSASVSVGGVAIIALLNASTNKSVTTAGILTGVDAGVGVGGVTIVALFSGLYDGVSADGASAAVWVSGLAGVDTGPFSAA
jgi:hypothetical protein